MPQMHLVYTKEQISAKVVELGAAITRDYEKVLPLGENLLMVGVLKGAFIFMADLIRAVELPVEVDFIQLSSYCQSDVSSTQVTMLKDLGQDVTGRHVLIVEDMVDCGLTLAWLLDHFQKKSPASVRVVVAVNKEARREIPVNPDYVGFMVQNHFLVGYGLDYAENYRNLPEIYRIDTRPTQMESAL